MRGPASAGSSTWARWASRTTRPCTTRARRPRPRRSSAASGLDWTILKPSLQFGRGRRVLQHHRGPRPALAGHRARARATAAAASSRSTSATSRTVVVRVARRPDDRRRDVRARRSALLDLPRDHRARSCPALGKRRADRPDAGAAHPAGRRRRASSSHLPFPVATDQLRQLRLDNIGPLDLIPPRGSASSRGRWRAPSATCGTKRPRPAVAGGRDRCASARVGRLRAVLGVARLVAIVVAIALGAAGLVDRDGPAARQPAGAAGADRGRRRARSRRLLDAAEADLDRAGRRGRRARDAGPGRARRAQSAARRDDGRRRHRDRRRARRRRRRAQPRRPRRARRRAATSARPTATATSRPTRPRPARRARRGPRGDRRPRRAVGAPDRRVRRGDADVASTSPSTTDSSARRADQGRQAKYNGGDQGPRPRPTAAIADARTLRDQLANTVDVTDARRSGSTGTRPTTWRCARLYAASRDVGRRVTERDVREAIAAEKAAQAPAAAGHPRPRDHHVRHRPRRDERRGHRHRGGARQAGRRRSHPSRRPRPSGRPTASRDALKSLGRLHCATRPAPPPRADAQRRSGRTLPEDPATVQLRVVTDQPWDVARRRPRRPDRRRRPPSTGPLDELDRRAGGELRALAAFRELTRQALRHLARGRRRAAGRAGSSTVGIGDPATLDRETVVRIGGVGRAAPRRPDGRSPRDLDDAARRRVRAMAADAVAELVARGVVEGSYDPRDDLPRRASRPRRRSSTS